MDLKEEAAGYVSQMTAEEKAALCIGADFWHISGIARLGLDGIMMADVPPGLRKQTEHHDSVRPSDSVPATCFPTASAVACTFDEDLAFRMGQAMGEECRAENVSVLLGPGVNMKRSPLGGRNFEYFSEDPLLAGKMGAAMIRGIQSVGVGASLKHFAVNSQENFRMVSDSVVDERALREIYLRAFEIAVKESRPWTVMLAYNKVNGTYCCENKDLLDILRREWSFDGVTVSDWGAVHDIIASINAGMDLEMPGVKNGHREEILRAAAAGTLEKDSLDRAAGDIVELLLKAREGKKIPYTCDMEAHHRLAREIASSAAVLLKNDGLLPGNSGQRTAVIGTLAEYGRYQGSGSSRIHPYRLDNALDALRGEIPDLVYAPGYRLEEPMADPELLKEAVRSAGKSDIVYLFAGLPDGWESEGFDRQHLGLPPAQTDLIEAVCRANPNTVVLLQAGSPVELPWAELPRAIMMLYLGGEAAGSAAADLLLGKVSPSGRLAETFPVVLHDTPCAQHYPGGRIAQHRESIYIGYRFYDAAGKETRFPFGYGLSYTTFSYRDMRVEQVEDDSFRVGCTVRNTGNMGAAEVVQLYASALETSTYRPIQELVGFQKIYLNANDEKDIYFTVKTGDLAIYDTVKGGYIVETGPYELRMGSSSREIRLRTSIHIAGTADVLDRRRAFPHYYTVDGSFPGKEFEKLLGHPLPEYQLPQKGSYGWNTTLEELRGSLPGRALSAVVCGCLRAKYRSNPQEGRHLWEMFAQTPMRQVSMAGISRPWVKAFLALCNGHYGKALRSLWKKD